jgi:hypothetical protein
VRIPLPPAERVRSGPNLPSRAFGRSGDLPAVCGGRTIPTHRFSRDSLLGGRWLQTFSTAARFVDAGGVISYGTNDSRAAEPHLPFVQIARADLRNLAPPSTLPGVLRVGWCHSVEFGQDRHFLEVLGVEACPVAEFQVAVAFALATAAPIPCDRDGAADDASSRGMSARATSSDQRSPRDWLAASSILSGEIRRGSSFLKPPRNLGVDTKTMTPRRSALARSGRCGESGVTLTAVPLFHGSILRRRRAATSAPAKFGMRPGGGNGKRATSSATRLSQTPLPRGALVSEVPGHDGKWSSAS